MMAAPVNSCSAEPRKAIADQIVLLSLITDERLPASAGARLPFQVSAQALRKAANLLCPRDLGNWKHRPVRIMIAAQLERATQAIESDLSAMRTQMALNIAHIPKQTALRPGGNNEQLLRQNRLGSRLHGLRNCRLFEQQVHIG